MFKLKRPLEPKMEPQKVFRVPLFPFEMSPNKTRRLTIEQGYENAHFESVDSVEIWIIGTHGEWITEKKIGEKQKKTKKKR
ncbi:MAG: hypothetical protein ACLFUH_06415 [Bacteroidales bacterium]